MSLLSKTKKALSGLTAISPTRGEKTRGDPLSSIEAQWVRLG
jgi:hypothetical protein